eukprot:TCONS_00064911-protein
MVPKENVTLVKLKRMLTEQVGIKNIANQLGWSDFDLHISRSKKSLSGGGSNLFAMGTDFQIRLELPRIINGDDKLNVKVYPIEARFRANAPSISIEVINGTKTQPETSKIVRRERKDKMEHIDVLFLKSEFAKLSDSKLEASSEGRTVKLKDKHRIWPWNV